MGPPKWAKELDEQNFDEDRPDPFARGSADPEPGESSGGSGGPLGPATADPEAPEEKPKVEDLIGGAVPTAPLAI